MGPFIRYSCSLCDLFLSPFNGEVKGEGSGLFINKTNLSVVTLIRKSRIALYNLFMHSSLTNETEYFAEYIISQLTFRDSRKGMV